METVTIREYKTKYTSYFQWKCPKCGAKNEPLDDDETEDACWNCNTKYRLHHRILRTKNY